MKNIATIFFRRVLRRNPDRPLSKKEKVILEALLRHQELYGLSIAVAAGVRLGALYVILNRLEKRGFIKARWGEQVSVAVGDARRRYYSLTDKGRKNLGKGQF